MYDFLNDAIFPSFRPFTSKDYVSYLPIYKKYYAPYGDISPGNLLVWLNIDKNLEVSRLDDAIVLRYENPFENGEQNFILLEPHMTEEHVRAIFALGAKKNQLVHMREQPSILTDRLPKNHLKIASNRNSYEYILSVHNQATLPGIQHDKQRQRMSRFERKHHNSTISKQYIESPSEDEKLLMLGLVSEWRLVANIDNHTEFNREFEALIYNINSIGTLHRSCLILMLDNKPVSFSLFTIYEDTAIVGHIKTDYEVQDIFDYTLHVLAKDLKKRKIRYINAEQDLGVPGLRKHKLHLRPIKMLEKVDISLRETVED